MKTADMSKRQRKKIDFFTGKGPKALASSGFLCYGIEVEPRKHACRSAGRCFRGLRKSFADAKRAEEFNQMEVRT